MNVRTDPNAAHAVYAPSSAHRWVPCTASAEAIANLPEQEEGEEAAEGTAAHEEIERLLKPYEGDGMGFWLERGLDSLIEPFNREHPAAYGIALLLDYLWKLGPGILWIERRVALTGDIWGRYDVCHFNPETGVLTIIDYKNGQRAVDAEENEQLRIYGAASMFTHQLPVKWARYAVVQPHDWRPFVPRVKQWFEPVEALYAWATRVAAIPAGPKSFVAGEHCRNCPLFGQCDASRDLLKELATVIATADEARPEQVALFLALKKPIEDFFKTFEKAATKKALNGTKFEGMKLVTTRPHKAWKDPEAAKALVLEKLGPAGLDVPTPAQAIERGIPEAIVNEIAPRPDGGPVLAFASDKRQEWKKKTGAEMFAGLANG